MLRRNLNLNVHIVENLKLRNFHYKERFLLYFKNNFENDNLVKKFFFNNTINIFY